MFTFQFDPERHEYLDEHTGEVFPSITQMLKKTGHVDDSHYKEVHRQRGSAVHQLCADFDLGALDLRACTSIYKPYVAAYAEFVRLVKPVFLAIEEPSVHPVYRFGGRPDRVCVIRGLKTVLEIKSGGREKHHRLQTALQAILETANHPLPAREWQRLCVYLTPGGRAKCDPPHEDPRDFDKAYEIIQQCCRREAA